MKGEKQKAEILKAEMGPRHLTPALSPTEAERKINAKLKAEIQRAEDGGRRDDVLTKVELAGRLKISVRCLENWMARGWVIGIKRGHVRRFVWGDVLDQLRKENVGGPRD